MRTVYFKLFGGFTTAGGLAYYPLLKGDTEFFYQKTEDNLTILNRCN